MVVHMVLTALSLLYSLSWDEWYPRIQTWDNSHSTVGNRSEKLHRHLVSPLRLLRHRSILRIQLNGWPKVLKRRLEGLWKQSCREKSGLRYSCNQPKWQHHTVPYCPVNLHRREVPVTGSLKNFSWVPKRTKVNVGQSMETQDHHTKNEQKAHKSEYIEILETLMG